MASPISSAVSSNVSVESAAPTVSSEVSEQQSLLSDIKDIVSVVKAILGSRNVLDLATPEQTTPLVRDLLAGVSSRIPAIQNQQPQYQFPNPFQGLTKTVQDLNSPAADYTQIKRFIEIVESRIASGTWTPYFDVLKDKFERVYSALKSSRNQQLSDALLQRQADVNRIVKDVTEKPEIAETLSEKQRTLDTSLQRLQASLSALNQLEAVGFDSRAEKQLRELLPLCDEIETLVDDKIQQLDTLREIYADFASLDDEKANFVSVMSKMAEERQREREQCTNDLQTLQNNFGKIKNQEAVRNLELERDVQRISHRESELDHEDRLIGALISKLLEKYESNQVERRRLAFTKLSAEKERVARSQLLTDASEEVEQHQDRLQNRMLDLVAANDAIKAFLDGTLKEIDQLDKMTASRHADYKKAYIQSLKEKYDTSVHHYRVIYKKIHALRNFKSTSQKLIGELQMNLRRWSELKRAAMVDTFNEQIAKSQQELRAADEESSLYSTVLARLDTAFESINAKMSELGEQPLIHPGLDIEAECLEQDRRRLEEEAALMADSRSTVEDELKLVNSRLESANLRRASSQLISSSVAPVNPMLASDAISSSFVQVPQTQQE